MSFYGTDAIPMSHVPTNSGKALEEMLPVYFVHHYAVDFQEKCCCFLYASSPMPGTMLLSKTKTQQSENHKQKT